LLRVTEMRAGTPYKIAKLDNASLGLKLQLRRRALRRRMELGSVPFILDAYAGFGRIWNHCYRDYEGVALEKDEAKCYELARLRPTWPVYSVDTPSAIEQGILDRFPINFLDVDTWGAPWECIEAWFARMARPKAETDSGGGFEPRLDIVATDGGGLGIRFTSGWELPRFQRYVAQYGATRMFDRYLDVCRDMMTDISAAAGYELVDWVALRTGRDKSMALFWGGFEA